jgi:hypothetical protein
MNHRFSSECVRTPEEHTRRGRVAAVTQKKQRNTEWEILTFQIGSIGMCDSLFISPRGPMEDGRRFRDMLQICERSDRSGLKARRAFGHTCAAGQDAIIAIAGLKRFNGGDDGLPAEPLFVMSTIANDLGKIEQAVNPKFHAA